MKQSNNNIETGICSTCNHIEKCLFNQSNPEAKIYCEEFDDYVNVPNIFIANKKEKSYVDNKPLNLHINCDNKANCMYRDTKTKLYCEEYL
ncbi:MAG: hypothetical protein WC223_01615 [Bacteroidales bacterium]|jgi:hypothetical protein